MFKTPRINELEKRIERLNQEIQEATKRAQKIYAYGKQCEQQLNQYFEPIIQANTAKLRTWLAKQPLSSATGWSKPTWNSWDSATSREESVIRIGDLVEQRTDGAFNLPAYVPFIGQNNVIIIRSQENSPEGAAELLRSLLIRTALMLPHQARYTLLDPAGNGIAFPMRRYMPEVRESSGDVRRDLDQVTQDIQRVIETYLDASVTSFEKIKPEIRINEKYEFIFAADFPNKYDRRAIEALQSVGNTGPVAGKYVFIHYNPDYELPRDMSMEGFKNAFYIDMRGGGTFTKLNLSLGVEQSPSADLQARLFEMLSAAKPPERMLDWDDIVGIPESDWWQKISTEIVDTPIGVRGGSDVLRVWFGVNENNQPCAHGMLGAMTGSGKSNLYHVLICGLAIRYSPAELRLYLIDGKDGVEFQPYRHLPHVKVVSLRSSPELSRSVLEELVTEKEYRNEIFAHAGVNDLVSYRAKGQPEGTLPRILLLVDEYQELFEGDRDGIASNYLLQLSQQGRSAGIHMLLASQRFGAAGMLNQTAIFGNIHLLMAMQMKAADVQALTEFGRRGKLLIATCDLPGKIIVNDQGGDDNANVAGKVAYLDLDRRESLLGTLVERSKTLPSGSLPRRVIFNGKAQPTLIDNPYFSILLRDTRWLTAKELETFARTPIEKRGLGIVDWFYAEHPRIVWLGQQFNVRGQAAVVFRRRVSENLMLVGSSNAVRYGMLGATLISLVFNAPPASSKFVILDRSIPGAQWNGILQTVCEDVLLPSGFNVEFSKEAAQVEMFLDNLVSELDRRRELGESQVIKEPSIFVMMTELDRVEKMRRKADMYGGMEDSPMGERLKRIYLEGPPLGIHTILSFSGVRPMSYVVDERRGLVNFRHRVGLQMSEDESYTFVRNRRAAQLQLEGPLPICALYVDMESDNATRFKPYTSDDSGEQGESFANQILVVKKSLANREN